MSQADTVTRILDSAEQLFAEKGFAETSLRMITTRAKVNLAAVNYHFGSKKELIQAVFARFLTPFTLKLGKELDAVVAIKRDPDFRDVLGVLANTMLTGIASNDTYNKLSVFMRLLGLAYTQAQGHLRRFLYENYADVYGRFIGYLKLAHPDLSSEAIFWRLHFAIGAAVFTMSSIEVLRNMAQADTGIDTSVEQVMAQLIPFLAAALEQET
ncbi:TetR/AcrR family transcriptional regulator [Reinekea sp.]|jgi:AcrR family transcriptional regulator|uniref:TetR/AcrR family transcriptional regulator n=1 Tax=Reinekea sp. TaxID=1970455 RepID=UPI002A83EBE2|nr:TetR/AcrR family transcriptional regulator [Reinekea sp.]